MGQYKKIRDIPQIDRPREKLIQKGPAALSDFELLEVLIGSGAGKTDVGTIARQVQKILHRGAQYITLGALLQIKGISAATASKILSSLEQIERHVHINARLLE